MPEADRQSLPKFPPEAIQLRNFPNPGPRGPRPAKKRPDIFYTACVFQRQLLARGFGYGWEPASVKHPTIRVCHNAIRVTGCEQSPIRSVARWRWQMFN